VHLQLTPINSALKFFFALGVHPHPLHPLTAPILPNPRGGASTKVNHLNQRSDHMLHLFNQLMYFRPSLPWFLANVNSRNP